MEFKDRLKKLRKEKAISQQELANAIYVSRSAVAKWENGLGIPNQASYDALLSYFNITATQLPLNEEIENICVLKNHKIHKLSTVIICLFLIIAIALSGGLYSAFQNGYGFTSKMAVGEVWQNNDYIHTPEYDFYYNTFSGEENLKIINHFCVAKKYWFGYQKLSLEKFQKKVYSNNKLFGYLYSFKGEKSYYHLFKSVYIASSPENIIHINLLPYVQIKEDIVSVFYNSYFETPFDVTEFYVNDTLYSVI